jgi:uroporphyrinogen-III decarboxylase
MSKFNISLSDSQSTEVKPVKPGQFDFEEYAAYSNQLNQKCKDFWNSESGVLVYRRMRVAECFSYGCKDMKFSLENQLGALQKSMLFKADVPNFLEPWYGIGTIVSAFGAEYMWSEGNAPALMPLFESLEEVLNYQTKPVSETTIGKHTLEMIEYFMDKTKGRLPVSFTDTQSALNMSGHLLPLDQMFIHFLTDPDKVFTLFDRLSDLSIAFNQEQHKLIGDALAYPGHGFSSSTQWKGLGMSDDNILMIAPEQYTEIASPSVQKICNHYGGAAFHSCGDWTGWIDAVLNIPGLKMVDAALSPETDPGATDNMEAFHKFANTGIAVNARIVGNADVVEEKLKRLWVPGMKLVVVTYCKTPEEQEKVYQLIHETCNE